MVKGRSTHILVCQRDALVADKSKAKVSMQLHVVAAAVGVVLAAGLDVFVVIDGRLLGGGQGTIGGISDGHCSASLLHCLVEGRANRPGNEGRYIILQIGLFPRPLPAKYLGEGVEVVRRPCVTVRRRP